MKKVFFKIEPFIKYFLIFIFFLFWNIIIQPINLDEIWNYGFAYNIYEGLIPYKDFNMVLTPFYPMVISFFFMLFGSNLLVMHIVNSLLITFMLWLIEKILKLNICVFVLILCFPLSVAFPSYNLFLLFLFVLIICLEKNNKSDFVIGVILGIFILTKQSVGVCLALPSIYYLFFDSKKFLKRILGIFIPCIIFLLYLLFTGSLYYFFDLCLFGMFDFASGNRSDLTVVFCISLLLLILTFYLIIKNKNKFYFYYLLSFYSILIPLFDLYHLELYFFAFLLIYLLEVKNKINFKFINFNLFMKGLLLGIVFLSIDSRFKTKVFFPNDIKNFEYRAVDEKYIKYTSNINSRNSKYEKEGKNIIFLSADGYYFRLINDMRISYIDLINKGNWGYNGSKKLLNYIKKNSDAVFFVDESELGTNKQTDQNALKFIIKNGKEIEDLGKYKIYVLGEI